MTIEGLYWEEFPNGNWVYRKGSGPWLGALEASKGGYVAYINELRPSGKKGISLNEVLGTFPTFERGKEEVESVIHGGLL